MFAEPLETLNLSEPVSVGPDATLREAIVAMNTHHVGCVLVGVDGKVVGIFSERDVLRKVAAGDVDIDQRRVSEFMTRDPKCLQCFDRVVHALNAMVEGGFRHVPILRDGVAIGVLSMRDAVEFLVELHPDAMLNAPPAGYLYGDSSDGG